MLENDRVVLEVEGGWGMLMRFILDKIYQCVISLYNIKTLSSSGQMMRIKTTNAEQTSWRRFVNFLWY